LVLEEAKWENRREWKRKRSVRLDGGKKGCDECYPEEEERGAGKGRRGNVKVFLSDLFQDACCPLQCGDTIKMMTSSSGVRLLIVQIVNWLLYLLLYTSNVI